MTQPGPPQASTSPIAQLERRFTAFAVDRLLVERLVAGHDRVVEVHDERTGRILRQNYLNGSPAFGGAAILFGSLQAEEGSVYNAVILAEDGKLVARRLKHELPNYGTFDEKRVFAAGPLPEPVEWRGVTLGIPICEDIWHPAVCRHLAEAGAQIFVCVNGSPYEIDKDTLRIDGVASLITTPYGTLILAKAALLAALIVFGWRQRRHVVPDGDRVSLVRFAGYEVLLMGIALGVSVALSRTAPPAGAIAGDHITAGALALLALAVPVVMAWAGARPSWLRRLTAAYPEPFAVAVAVLTYVMAAVVPSGLLGIGNGAEPPPLFQRRVTILSEPGVSVLPLSGETGSAAAEAQPA